MINQNCQVLFQVAVNRASQIKAIPVVYPMTGLTGTTQYSDDPARAISVLGD